MGLVLGQGPDTERAPDIAFVPKARAVRTRKFIEGAPALAVEILSPGDLASEVRAKVGEYLAAGTRLVWILDPGAKTASVHRADGSGRDLTPTDALDGENLLPGLRIELAEVFAD